MSDIPTVYYRVGQDETVDSVIEVYVYSTDGDECPQTLTSDNSELNLTDCGEKCGGLFENGIIMSYTPTEDQASTVGTYTLYLRVTLDEDSSISWTIPVEV